MFLGSSLTSVKRLRPPTAGCYKCPVSSNLSTQVLPAFQAAQRRTIALLGDVIARLEAQMSERDVADLATDLSQGRGFTGWFHTPQIRIDRGPGPLLRHSAERRLRPGAIVQIDLAPATEQAFGDLGVSVAFQAEQEPALITEARSICQATCGFASRWKCVGELYVFAQAWANNRRLSIGDARSIGHACLPREGMAATAWPRVARSAIVLRRNQIQWFTPRRMAGVYAVSPPIVMGDRAASFEEMIFVDADRKLILGRDSPDEIGTW